MSERSNSQIKLAARPVGLPKPTDWEFVTSTARDPEAGEALVKVLYLSLDPAMRGWMNEGRSYIPPVKIGEEMRAGGVGVVVASADPSLSPGDHVYGTLDVQEYATRKAASLTRVNPKVAALPVYLNVLGMPGMTAYFGLFEVGRPKPGETVVVSGAAGAVGMTVGQLAKIHGCRVVGIAGGPEKCAYVRDELGFDAAIDYKSEDLNGALRQHCPNGIDVYFDNVGGATLDACLARLALHARVVICGAISQYNNTTAVTGPSNYLSLLVNRATMQGMVVFDYAKRYPEAVREMAGWIAEGKLKSREDVVKGIDTFPETLLKLFRGENFGKLVLEVAAP
jgi:NADPH-dependent curcumin reductase CurA